MPPGTDRVPFVCLPAVLTDRPLLTPNVLSELNTDWQQGDGAGGDPSVRPDTKPFLPSSSIPATVQSENNNNSNKKQ